jgi:hypothetical protein
MFQELHTVSQMQGVYHSAPDWMSAASSSSDADDEDDEDESYGRGMDVERSECTQVIVVIGKWMGDNTSAEGDHTDTGWLTIMLQGSIILTHFFLSQMQDRQSREHLDLNFYESQLLPALTESSSLALKQNSQIIPFFDHLPTLNHCPSSLSSN